MNTITRTLIFAGLGVASVALALQAGAMHLAVGKEAPSFAAQGTNGKMLDLSEMRTKGSTFVLFWKERCPHNRPAAPLYNQLAKAYGEKVQFVGVVPTSAEGAKTWKNNFQTTYPLVADTDKSLVKGYELVASIVVFQIGKDGKVEAVFPGYGRDSINKLNQAMAKTAEMPVAEIDLTGAPQGLTWG